MFPSLFCLRIKSAKFADKTGVLHSNYYNSLLDSAESYFIRRTASFLWENVVDFYNLIRGLRVRRRFVTLKGLNSLNVISTLIGGQRRPAFPWYTSDYFKADYYWVFTIAHVLPFVSVAKFYSSSLCQLGFYKFNNFNAIRQPTAPSYTSDVSCTKFYSSSLYRLGFYKFDSLNAIQQPMAPSFFLVIQVTFYFFGDAYHW